MNTVTCPDCFGKKYDEVLAPDPAHSADTEYSPCSTCGARGVVPVEDCPGCQGRGMVDATRIEAVPEQGNVGRESPGRAPCLSCDGWGKKARVRGELIPLPPEVGEELEGKKDHIRRRVAR